MENQITGFDFWGSLISNFTEFLAVGNVTQILFEPGLITTLTQQAFDIVFFFLLVVPLFAAFSLVRFIFLKRI